MKSRETCLGTYFLDRCRKDKAMKSYKSPPFLQLIWNSIEVKSNVKATSQIFKDMCYTIYSPYFLLARGDNLSFTVSEVLTNDYIPPQFTALLKNKSTNNQ